MLPRVFFLLGLLPTVGIAAPSNELDPVVRLYRDFAWEAVIDTPAAGPALLSESDAVWSRYFSPRLIKLLRKDRQCVSRTRGVCKLDFSPIWASQDPGAARLKVVPGDAPATVNVFFDYPANRVRIGMKFFLKQSGARWFIDDIQYGDGRRLGTILEARE